MSEFALSDSLVQFLACAQTLLEKPEDFEPDGLKIDSETARLIRQWYGLMNREITGSKAGYPQNSVLDTPKLEDAVIDIAKQIPALSHWPRKSTRPALCLTHDIDYLAPTLQMNIKRLISERRLKWSRPTDHYLDSLQTLLALDAETAGRTGVSTVFVPCPVPARGIVHQLKQWIVDPSYRPQDRLFASFRDLLTRYNCEIGLHGSFFSLTDNLLSRERLALEAVLGCSVRSGRQHWLNLPHATALSEILESGIEIDSTLGWNGAVGFRGGFSRPFPVCLPQGKLWEIPLLLMDGPLFDDLGLDTRGVVAKSIELLEAVYQRGGCVAINWHDRAAHAEYGWSDAYAAILVWAKEKGFRFLTISEAVEEAQTSSMAVEVN